MKPIIHYSLFIIHKNQQGFIKLTKKGLVMILIFSILLPTIILYSLFIIPKKVSAEWFACPEQTCGERSRTSRGDDTWGYL